MNMLVRKVPDVVLPVKGNPDDFCYDLTATSDPIIVGEKVERFVDGINGWKSIEYIAYKTSLHFAPQSVRRPVKNVNETKYSTIIVARSSITKKNLILANVPIIDNGFRGEIELRFRYVIQPRDLRIITEYGRSEAILVLSPDSIFDKGDRIAQMFVLPNTDVDFTLVESLDGTKRSTGAFGSTGK